MNRIQIGSVHSALGKICAVRRHAVDTPLRPQRLRVRPSLGLFMFMLASASPSVTVAQPGPTSAPSQAQENIEEIVVTGERRKIQLRLQMIEAEKVAYDIFNKFNDERRFNISCSTQVPTGSRIESEMQLCQPEFEIQAHRAHAQDMLEDFRLWYDGSNPNKIGTPTSQPAPALITSQQKAYRAKLKKIAEEQPEFLQALIKYSELKAEYEAAD